MEAGSAGSTMIRSKRTSATSSLHHSPEDNICPQGSICLHRPYKVSVMSVTLRQPRLTFPSNMNLDDDMHDTANI
jgi:hypothetical protein